MAKTIKKTEIDLLNIDPSRTGGEEPAVADPSPPPTLWKRFSVVIYILAGLLIISGGIMASVLLGWLSFTGPGEPATNTGPAAGALPAKAPEKPREMGPMVKLNSLVINLNEADGPHYIKTSMVLELERADYLEDIQSRTAPLIDTAILSLGDQNLSDLRKPEYKDQLKKTLTVKMNDRLRARKIKQIYFDEFLYQ